MRTANIDSGNTGGLPERELNCRCLHFYAAWSSLFLGSYTLRMNASSRLNRLFALVSLNFAVWSFAYSFSTPAPDKETAWFWYRISALGWAVAPALAMHFFLVLTENDALIQRWWAKVVLYLPGVFFLSEALTGTLLVSDFIPCVLGWCEVAPAFSPLFWLFQCYAIGSVVGWIVMTARWASAPSVLM